MIPVPDGRVEITEQILSDAMITSYRNIIFSTFPYHHHNLTSSEDALQQFNSGNCIALALFIVKYLKSNYNIGAYIIPATVPEIYKVQNTPILCHCAVMVPISTTRFVIIDCAFNFLQPMICSMQMKPNRLNNPKIEFSDIYSHKNEQIEYQCVLLDSNHNDDAQIISRLNANPRNLNRNRNKHESIISNYSNFKVDCVFDFNKDQKWAYYPFHVLNPDECIGQYCLKAKPNPFLLYTEYDHVNIMVKLIYKLSRDENGNFMIKTFDKYNFGNYNSEKISTDTLRSLIQRDLYKYLSF